MIRDNWEDLLDKTPTDHVLRLQFSDWLEENKLDDDAFCQRWLVKYNKWPGPCALKESKWWEASFFTSLKAGTTWGFPDFNSWGCKIEKILENWCLPEPIFQRLYTLDYYADNINPKQRHLSMHHTRYVRTFDGRRYAEENLSYTLKRLKSSDFDWQREDLDPWLNL